MSSTESSEAGAVSALQAPEHHDQQIDRQNPDQDDLPKPQIARAIVIGSNVWVARDDYFWARILSSSRRRKTSQFSNHARNNFDRAIDVLVIIESAERKTQAPAGLLIHQPHRTQHVRRLK